MRPFLIPDSITPAWVKAMVLQLKPDEGDDSDAEQQIRMELEREFAADLTTALRDQMNDLIPPTATDTEVRAAPSQVSATSEPVRATLRRYLQQGAELGASIAFDQMSNIGMAFDFTLAHTAAAQWASRYSYDLIHGMNQTTQTQMQIAVDEWFKDQTSLGMLRDQLAPTFGKKRAQLIAQTETTRAAYQGSKQGYQESGVVSQVEWVTVNDERVCPQCGPLDGTRAPLDGAFDGDTPPLHPGCRCFVRPVVDEPQPSAREEQAAAEPEAVAPELREAPITPKFESVADAEKWADENLKTKFSGFGKAGLDASQAAVESIARFEAETGKRVPALIEFNSKQVPRNAYAIYKQQTRTIYLKEFKTNAEVLEANAKDTATWQSRGYTSQWTTGQGIRGLLEHETGHAIDDAMGRSGTGLMANQFQWDAATLSGQATKNTAESWAEAFTAVRLKLDVAQTLPPDVVEQIERITTPKAKP